MPSSRRTVLLATTCGNEAAAQGIWRFARENDWHLIADMLHTGSFPKGWQGDGILALVAYQPELITHLQMTGLPGVSIALTDEYSPFARVEPDNEAIGRTAALYLLERGCRTFAWAPFINDRHSRERLQGFESVLREHHRTCEVLPPIHRRVGPYWHEDWQHRRNVLIRSLSDLPKPAAVFASNDCAAAETAEACLLAGIAVPREVAIIGAGNDSAICESGPVPLSSIDPDHEGMAYRAAEILERIMAGSLPREGTTRIAPRGVVTRASTGSASSVDPRIAHALTYISENYPDPLLDVGMVARAVGLSRRQLEREFRNSTGETVRTFIERSRMNEASRLLVEHPRTRIATIAELVGLAGPGSFFRTFRRHFGLPPSEYRLARTIAEGVERIHLASLSPAAITPEIFAAPEDDCGRDSAEAGG